MNLMRRFIPIALATCVVAPSCWLRIASGADWQTDDWEVVESTAGVQKRPAAIRSIVRTSTGRLLGTRPTGPAIELWRSDTNGVDWSRLATVAQSSTISYGDSTLHVLPSGEILAGFREQHPTLGWSVRLSRSLDGGQSWAFGGTIQDWTLSPAEFVGAPFFHRLSDGTLQAYYDSELAATGSSQYIALKSGTFNDSLGEWQWANERVVNTAPAGASFVRDGLATVVPLGPDLDGVGDRLMVVTEAVSVTNGVAHNVIRAFQVQNGGAAQGDWNNLLDSRVIYQSAALDAQGRRFNAYAPYAIRVGDGPVLVAFSTDEALDAVNQAPDAANSPVDMRHSEIKVIHTTSNFETWSAPYTAWGLDHPDFDGDANSGDIHNYQFGMFELSPNDVLATLDLFGGKQLVFRPSLGGLSADFTEDGVVDGADLLRWQRGVGLSQQATTTTGDATGEGSVTGADLARWASQFGAVAGAAGTNAVPEPGCGAIASSGLLLVARGRSRRRLA